MAEPIEGEETLYDISRIDFNRLRAEFERSQTKRSTVQTLKQVIDRRLQKMMEQNPTRTDFQRHYEAIVAEYNREKDRATIEATFEALFKFYQGLDEESDRALREGLDQESLAIYDLLKKPDLNAAEIERIKAIAIELLNQLKADKLKIDHWHDKEFTRDAVKGEIYDFLWSDNTGLSPDSYENHEVEEKTEEVFQHILRVYPILPSPYYTAA